MKIMDLTLVQLNCCLCRTREEVMVVMTGGGKRKIGTYYIRDDDHNLTGNDVVFHYTKDNQGAVIPWEMVRDVELFTGDEWVAKQLVKKWLKKTYGIDPVKLFKKF